MKNGKLNRILCAVVSAALFAPIASIGIGAQTRQKLAKETESIAVDYAGVQTPSFMPEHDDVPRKKVSAELEEKTEELARFTDSKDTLERVIISLKPETNLDESFGEIEETQFKAMLEQEVRSSKAKRDLVRKDLTRLGGRVKRSSYNVGLVTAELPLSKIKELSESEQVEYISPDRELQATGHVDVTTGASKVRALISGMTLEGTGVGVAVIDSGLDYNHGAFVGIGSNGVWDSSIVTRQRFGTDTTSIDTYGHGSHVGSIIGGRADWKNAYYKGIAPKAKLVSLSVLNRTGLGSASNLVAAIDWMIANKTLHNIRVANISLGAVAKDSYRNDPMCKAVRRAVNAGIVVVVSAGNKGKDAAGRKLYGSIGTPGIEPSAITVGAVNTYGTDARTDDTIATYSSRGPTRGYVKDAQGVRRYDNLIKPDIVAPGNKIIGASALGFDTGGGNYRNPLTLAHPELLVTTDYIPSIADVAGEAKGSMRLSGTSMAAPVVTGAVALMLQARPKLTPSLVKAILMYTAQPMSGYNSFEQGAGHLNIDGALQVTKLVRTTLPTTNGASLLTAALPTSQSSVIATTNVPWGKGVMTNYGFLTGNDLMLKWQGMYGMGVLIGDGTPFGSTAMTRSTTLTSGTMTLYQGAIKNNGVLIGDGTLFASANSLGGTFAPSVNPYGVLVGDGVLISDGDGVLIGDGDGVLIGDGNLNPSQSYLGDNTMGMAPAP